MILDNFLPVLWINMNRSTERRERMKNLFEKYSIKNTRIEAVDSKNQTKLESLCIMNKSITRAENACTMSHFLALRHFVDNMSNDKVIIFEDDVSLEFLPLIPFNWSELVNNLPKNYNVVQLAVCSYRNVYPKIVQISHQTSYSSVAYMITKKAAIHLLNKYTDPVTKKINLENKKQCTADAVILSLDYTFSIPIFTYETNDSTIHKSHLAFHSRTKKQQLEMWKLVSSNKKYTC